MGDKETETFLFTHCEFSGVFLIQFSAHRVWKKPQISIQLLESDVFETDRL